MVDSLAGLDHKEVSDENHERENVTVPCWWHAGTVSGNNQKALNLFLRV